MYLKELAIKNIGPISKLCIKLPFWEDLNPKPIIFVWENWTWKTLLEAQIIDWLYEIFSKSFNDIAKYDWIIKKYYKISWGINLQIWKDNGFSILSFQTDKWDRIEYVDKVWHIENSELITCIENFWLTINWDDNIKKVTEIKEEKKEEFKKEIETWTYFYQPAYRYEEPYRKNNKYYSDTKFEDSGKFVWELNKPIEILTSLDENKSFLMDLVLDFKNDTNDFIDQNTWNNINNVLKKIKKREDIRFGIGPRWGYRISIVVEDKTWKPIQQLLPSIDNLSLWEIILLNLFINIIRYWDNPPKTANEIKWIVIIDEIDTHLHTNLQNSVLPELIKMFPKVQFIITTHSPLFVLWMKRIFWENNFEIRNMPDWELITTERFSEFENAYNIMRQTEKFDNDLKNFISNREKPIVYVEWPTDVQYIKKAYKLYNKSTEGFDIEIIWSVTHEWTIDSNNKALEYAEKFLKHNTNIINQKIILLNDPEENRNCTNYDNLLYVRKMEKYDNHPIEKWIENLFENSLIQKARNENPNFFLNIENHWEITKIASWKKQKLCNRICENATIEDFRNFEWIFNIIEDILWN